jgi:hypothetical protein
MQPLLAFILSMLCGGIGGNAIGALVNRVTMGGPANTMVGALGGAMTGYILNLLPGTTSASLFSSALGEGTFSAVVSNIVGGGVTGIVLTLILGLIKNLIAPSRR